MSEWTIDRIRLRCKEDDAGCWVWQQTRTSGGYPLANIDGRTGVMVRRWVYMQAHGKVPGASKWRVVSTCGNKLCCNPGHLRLASVSTVLRQQWADGSRVGQKTPQPPSNARLTPQIAQMIRADQRDSREIAEEYGICRSHVYAIRRGEAWQQRQRIASVWDLGRAA